jgi:hypothetical protein
VANVGMNSAWLSSPHRMLKSPAKLLYVKALTRGIRNLSMNWSVSQAGDTKTHLVVGKGDELIPERAHERLWKEVPDTSKGFYIRLDTTHDSVEKDPDLIANAIDQAVH